MAVTVLPVSQSPLGLYKKKKRERELWDMGRREEWKPGSMSQRSDLCRRMCVCEGKRNILSKDSKYLRNGISTQMSVGTLFKNSTNELLMSM